jgi:hypothetical protein
MNIPNTMGPPIIAAVPEFTPAKSQAFSNEAPAGFHNVAFALEGSGEIRFELQFVRHDASGVRQHPVR